MEPQHPTARLQILLTAVLFSTGGAAIKACSLGGWQVAGLRSGLAALAVLALVPASRRRPTRATAAVAVTYGTTLILFVLANKLTTAANTIFLQATAPLYTMILAPILLREPLRRRDLVLLGAFAAGLGLFFVGSEAPSRSAPDPVAGNLLGAACGVTWALTILGLRGLGRRGDGSAATAVVVGNVMAFVVAMPLGGWPVAATTADWVVVAYLGFFQIGVAYALLTAGIRHVPAFEASLLLLAETVLNPVWAWVFLGEFPGGWSLAACAVILGATVACIGLDALAARRRR